MRKWLPMIILASAQFVMVLDSSVMNVAISQIVDDLDTTIQGVQTAITLYTLVMAAFMLLGREARRHPRPQPRLRDRPGDLRRRLADHRAEPEPRRAARRLVGRSRGSARCSSIPAIAALTAATYEGTRPRARLRAARRRRRDRRRRRAADRRLGDDRVHLALRVRRRDRRRDRHPARCAGRSRRRPAAERRPQLDGVGVALSSIGLGPDRLRDPAQQRLGIRPAAQRRRRSTAPRSRRWASRRCRSWSSAASRCSAAFAAWEAAARPPRARPAARHDAAAGRRSCAPGSRRCSASSSSSWARSSSSPSTSRSCSGLDAFETGKRLLPLSVAMLVFALLGPRIAARRSPRTVAQLGLVAVSIGAIVMLATLDVELNDTGFKVALALIGAGAGLLASQLGNVIMSSVPPDEDQRGRRAPGHRAEPRVLARHGDHRRRAARVAGDGLQRAHHRQPGRPGGGARDDRRQHRRGDRHRAGRRRRAGGRRGRARRRIRRAPSPRTTATLSSRRCGWRSARSRSPPCCRSGSRAGCRRGRLPRAGSAPAAYAEQDQRAGPECEQHPAAGEARAREPAEGPRTRPRRRPRRRCARAGSRRRSAAAPSRTRRRPRG